MFKNLEILKERYFQLLDNSTKDISTKTKTPHNFLLTPNWMLVVPRTKDKNYPDTPINSLGFIGCLITKQVEKLEFIKEVTPLKILEEVSYPL